MAKTQSKVLWKREWSRNFIKHFHPISITMWKFDFALTNAWKFHMIIIFIFIKLRISFVNKVSHAHIYRCFFLISNEERFEYSFFPLFFFFFMVRTLQPCSWNYLFWHRSAVFLVGKTETVINLIFNIGVYLKRK